LHGRRWREINSEKKNNQREERLYHNFL
jgi:hypothetical protein